MKTKTLPDTFCREVWLSKLVIDMTRYSGQLLASNGYNLHDAVYQAHPPVTVETRAVPGRILFRVDDRPNMPFSVLVQSANRPNWNRLMDNRSVLSVETKRIDYSDLSPNSRFSFRLVLNPYGILSIEDGKKKWSSMPYSEIPHWIKFQFLNCAKILDMDVGPPKTHVFSKDDKNIKLTSYTIDGILDLVDPNGLAYLMTRGIGHGKGFGFGLLTIAKFTN